MKRSLLRAGLIGISGILLAAAAWLSIIGCTLATAFWVAIPGLVLVFGLLVERWRYKPLTSCQPGPDWLATDERFVDPERENRSPSTTNRQPASGAMSPSRSKALMLLLRSYQILRIS